MKFLKYLFPAVIISGSIAVNPACGWNSGAILLRTGDAVISYDPDNDAWISTKPLRYPANTMGATVIVASSTSKNKQSADYICDGIADDAEINAAIQAVIDSTVKQGTVKILEGQYNITAPVRLYQQKILLEGTGEKATLLNLSSNSNCNVIEVSPNASHGGIFFGVSQLRVIGNRTTNNSGWGIYVNDKVKDFFLRNVSISNCYDGGVYIGSAWGHVAENIVSEYNLGPGYYIDVTTGIEAKITNAKVMNNDNTQFKIYHSNPVSFGSVKVVNGRFMAVNNNTTVVEVNAGGNMFVNCDVGASGKTGVTLINCTGTRNQFTNMTLTGIADTVAVAFQTGAQSNYIQGVTSFSISDPDRILITNNATHNRIILPRRHSGYTCVDSGARLDAPLIGDATNKTINLLFDNGSANKPGIRYNHTAGKLQYTHNGTDWTDF